MGLGTKETRPRDIKTSIQLKARMVSYEEISDLNQFDSSELPRESQISKRETGCPCGPGHCPEDNCRAAASIQIDNSKQFNLFKIQFRLIIQNEIS